MAPEMSLGLLATSADQHRLENIAKTLSKIVLERFWGLLGFPADFCGLARLQKRCKNLAEFVLERVSGFLAALVDCCGQARVQKHCKNLPEHSSWDVLEVPGRSWGFLGTSLGSKTLPKPERK